MLPSENTSLPPFASMLPPFPGATLGPTDEIYGDGAGTVAFEEDTTNLFDLLRLAPGHKRGHDDDGFFGNYDGTETLPNKRPRPSTPDDAFPFSPLDQVSDFQLLTDDIKEESPTAIAHVAYYPQKQDEPALSSPTLGPWAESLSAADKRVALQFLRLPTDKLVETMFHSKSRYERKVRTVVKSLKDKLQLAKDANTIILDQYVASSHRETFLDKTLTEMRWQLLQKEQVTQGHLAAIERVSALEKQVSEYQKELDKPPTPPTPPMQWNERKDSIQIDMGVPISVQTVIWGVLFPATLQDTLTFSYLKKITYIKKIWNQSLPGEAHAITKIEYIMNEELYALFKAAKTDLEKTKRPCTEKILFHGTAAGNIDSILTEGFKIGGIDGHVQRHGASHVVSPRPRPLTVGPRSLLRSETKSVIGL